MIDRLEKGDAVEFTVAHKDGSTKISGSVRERTGHYIRIIVDTPVDQPNVTLVGDDKFAPALTVRQDYTWELLGTAPMLSVVSGDFKTVMHAK